MAVLPRQNIVQSSTSYSSSKGSTQVYLLAVLLAIFSFVVLLLIIPPMIWHFRNRNMGATALVAWVVLLLLFNFVNAVLWPSDDISEWYDGSGLCDVEVKIQVASQVAFPAALACVLRALAAVMNTDRTTLTQTKYQRRRTYMIDLSWCIGFPLLQMLLHYVVQTRRYYLYGISGCVPAVSDSIVTIFLLVLPPFVWTLADAYFAVLILVRLYGYRLNFSAVLANSNTSKSRFLRLYIICIMWIVCYIPIQCYVIYINIQILAKTPYSWSETHSKEYWDQIVMVPSGGQVVYDRWIWLTCGIIVFIFFGFGRDAVNMYRSGLLAIGLGKICPSLRSDHCGSITTSISSLNRKAKLLFKRKSSTSSSTWTSASSASHTSSSVDDSPKKMTFLGTIDEALGTDEKHPYTLDQQKPAAREVEIGLSSIVGTSLLTRLMSSLGRKKAPAPSRSCQPPLPHLGGPQASVEAAVISGPRSPALSNHVRNISSDQAIVRKEIRQESEHERHSPA